MKDTIVFTTWDEPLADMALNFLRDAGICAVKRGEVPRSAMPFTIDGLGQIEISVPEEDIDQALEIIAVRFSEEGVDAFLAVDNELEPPEPSDFEETSGTSPERTD